MTPSVGREETADEAPLEELNNPPEEGSKDRGKGLGTHIEPRVPGSRKFEVDGKVGLGGRSAGYHPSPLEFFRFAVLESINTDPL